MKKFFVNELRLLLRERSVLVLLLVTAAAFGLAAQNGAGFATGRAAESQRVLERTEAEIAADRAKVAAGEIGGPPWADPGNPYRRKAAVTLPPGPAAALAVGMSDLQASWAEVSIYSLPSRPFRNYEIGSPLNRASGSFDPAFVLVFLFPLLLLALTYDLVSGDREKGVLALAAAQGAELGKLVLGKLLARAVLGVGAALVFSWLALLLLTGAARPSLAALLLWSAVLVVYAAFWLALGFLVATRGGSSSSNALILGGIWLLLAMVAPMALHLTAAWLHELPSRHELIARERDAETAGLREQAKLLEKFALDHPELMPSGQPVDWTNFAASYYASRQDLEKRLEPIATELERKLRARRELVGRYRFLSPAVVAYEAVLEIAGTGSGRHQAFLDQLAAFLADWRARFVPKTFSGQPMTLNDFDTMPRFTFAEESAESLARRLGASLLGVAIPTAIFLLWGRRRLSEIDVMQGAA